MAEPKDRRLQEEVDRLKSVEGMFKPDTVICEVSPGEEHAFFLELWQTCEAKEVYFQIAGPQGGLRYAKFMKIEELVDLKEKIEVFLERIKNGN